MSRSCELANAYFVAHCTSKLILSNRINWWVPSVYNLDTMTHEPKQNPAQFVTINRTHCDLQWYYRRVYFNQNVIYDPFLGICRNLHQHFFFQESQIVFMILNWSLAWNLNNFSHFLEKRSPQDWMKSPEL